MDVRAEMPCWLVVGSVSTTFQMRRGRGPVAELEDVGLVGVEVVFAKSTERDDFETKRRRLRYTLADDSALEV